MNRVRQLETPVVFEIPSRLKLFTSDMRYARVPLKVKTKKDENQKQKKTMVPKAKKSAEAVAAGEQSSELGEPRWSVVSFDKLIGSNLTYEAAAEQLEKLVAEKISGLCIIADEAAARMFDKTSE